MNKAKSRLPGTIDTVNVSRAVAPPAPALILPKAIQTADISSKPLQRQISSTSVKSTTSSTAPTDQKQPAMSSTTPKPNTAAKPSDAGMTPEQLKQRDYQRGFSLWVSQHQEMKKLVNSLTENFKEEGTDEDYASFRAKEQGLQKSLYQQWLKLSEEERKKSSIIACRLLGVRSVLENKPISSSTTSTITVKPTSSSSQSSTISVSATNQNKSSEMQTQQPKSSTSIQRQNENAKSSSVSQQSNMANSTSNNNGEEQEEVVEEEEIIEIVSEEVEEFS